jgi:DNA recombination protein RmuC
MCGSNVTIASQISKDDLMPAISLITVILTAATLTVVIILAFRNKLPGNFEQLPDRLTRLDTLHEQLSSQVREGFRESRLESGTAIAGIRDNLNETLAELRADINSLKSEVSTQIISLSSTVQERLAGFSSTTSDSIHQFTNSVDAKLETTNSLVRTEIQTQIGTMQSALTGSFSELSSRTSDAFAALHLLVTGKLDAVLDSMHTQHGTLRSALEDSFAAFKGDVTNGLNQLESKQTTNNATLQEGIERTLTRLSSQLKDSLDVQRQQLADVASKTEAALTTVKQSVEASLKSIADGNEKKLEQMRETVDEKLHSTLEKRLADSFSLVSDQLGKVQTGLGEMKDLASSVGDLKRVLTNVKSRGGFAEIQLGAQLENTLAANQYRANVRVKPDTTESVEFAISLPGNNGEECLLPIDAKFPKEAWERLETARESATAEDIRRAAEAFESVIRTEAKRISEKYINPPTTTNFAYMYLPTEALFAEVVRNPGLLDDIQTKHRVSVAGPTTLMALLISFQMGFQTLAIQKKGSEVWNVLAGAKVQFGKFGDLMTRVERNVGTVQKTLQEIGTRTRVINRTLSSVGTLDSETMSAAELPELSPDNTQEIAQAASAGLDKAT